MLRRTMTMLALVAALPVLAGACRTATPLGHRDVEGARGTLTGTVTGANGAAAVGRTVEATEETTGARLTTVTNESGGYSIMVPKGRYRIRVVLRAGEVMAEDPGVVDVSRSDAESRLNLVIGLSGN